MQVGGNYNSNYNSYSGSDYNYNTHTHHITECLHEEQISSKRTGAQAGAAGVTLEIHGKALENTQSVVTETKEHLFKDFRKKSLGFLQGFWDFLGQEGNRQATTMNMSEAENSGQGKGVLRGVSTIIPMIRQGFNVFITERLETFREKLKVGIHTALKRFGKDSEPFGALTDPGTGSLFGSRTGNGTGKGRSKSGNRHIKEEEIESASGVNEHLMDSYSKSGKYCKINENLTYSRGRAPYKVSERNTQRKIEDSF